MNKTDLSIEDDETLEVIQPKVLHNTRHIRRIGNPNQRGSLT